MDAQVFNQVMKQERNVKEKEQIEKNWICLKNVYVHLIGRVNPQDPNAKPCMVNKKSFDLIAYLEFIA